MQISTILSISLLALGVAAQKSGPNGKRICIGGAISCQYEKGRCANFCNDTFNNGAQIGSFVDSQCSCPEGQADNKYTGASCIDFVRAFQRTNC